MIGAIQYLPVSSLRVETREVAKIKQKRTEGGDSAQARDSSKK